MAILNVNPWGFYDWATTLVMVSVGKSKLFLKKIVCLNYNTLCEPSSAFYLDL